MAGEKGAQEQDAPQPWPNVGLDGDDEDLKEDATKVDPLAEWKEKAEEQQKKQADAAKGSGTHRG